MFSNGGRLREAVLWGQTDKVTKLLRSGANPNSRNGDGWSALHIAVNNDHEGLIDLLIAGGADVELRTKSGQSPLEIAVQRLKPRVVEILLGHGADPGARNSHGRTALQELAHMEQVFAEPIVLGGVRISTDDEIRECRELAALLRRSGAVT
jgi:ankyrin repeat protein